MFQGYVGKFLDTTVDGSEIPNNSHCLDGAKPIVKKWDMKSISTGFSPDF